MKPDENVLRLLFWETTAGCNLECIHCRRLDVSKQLMQNDLSTEQSFAFLRNLSSYVKPILVLSGGEPLFRPDIFDIAKYASNECGLTVALATNGTLIDETVARKIVDSGIQRVAISIDGADETTHDNFRKQQGSLAAALRGFHNLKKLGMSLQINCTVTKHNAHQIGTLYDKAVAMGADALHLFMLVPVGCGVQIAESNMLPAEEYERVLNWMYDQSKLGEIHLKATCAPHYFRVMKQRQVDDRRNAKVDGIGVSVAETTPAAHPHAQAHAHARGHGAAPAGGPPRGMHPQGMAAMTKGCLAGSAICFVSHTGEVFPCGYLPVSAGNVRQQTFQDIWENSVVFNRLRDDSQLEGKCGVCEFKRVCMGCRARAFYDADGDYMAEEPYCVYEPKRMRDEMAHSA
jgi:radical SAM protein with 4Fe4S-binding SPASM domain